MIALTNPIKVRKSQKKSYPGQPSESSDMAVASEAIDKLITEGGESFYKYVDSRGLSNDSSLIVLSSTHHYYYDYDEMNKAKTVVNLKKLNLIKEIKSLFHSHLHFLPHRCNFVGCFVNNKKIDRYSLSENVTGHENLRNSNDMELGIVSRFRFINMLYSMMDSKTNNYLSEESVVSMLRVHGFKVIDMKEVNGLTYFHSQKVGASTN